MQENKLEKNGGNPKKSYKEAVRTLVRSLDFKEIENEDKQEDDYSVDNYSIEDKEESDTSSDESEDPSDPNGENRIKVRKDAFDRLDFTLSEKEWKRLCKPFKKSLIIKLLGKTVGFKFLLKKVNQLWGRTREIELVDLGNDYFLAKFDTFADQDFALIGGPWIILDHYLIIRPWTSLFSPNEQIQKLAAWVHLPDLPIELYDINFLSTLGNHIGKVIRIDVKTTQQLRGKYARLCVELDLEEPLLSQYCVHGMPRKIEYEGLHFICFECGIYGHDIEHCRIYKERKEKERKEKEQNAEKGTGDEESLGKNMGDSIERYGAWMTAQKPVRIRRTRSNPPSQQNVENKIQQAQCSRFAVLENNNKEDHGAKIIQPENENKNEKDSKVWTKSRKNPVFETQQTKENTSDQRPAFMEIGSPVKDVAKETESTEPQIDLGGDSVAMVISPRDEKIDANQNQNLKDKPPDPGRKKPPNTKGQSAPKVQSKGSRREFQAPNTPS
ncbi:uncharacterized protein G2W53_008332 [Senna tora]|uniref:DUF4283 domain-containing protein n=1 Tax=Senna tora TaxID=362788 RepID=A0A835CGW2_9FABA|nr:uncharacterized protein G2W53_008332 [Senna tora]